MNSQLPFFKASPFPNLHNYRLGTEQEHRCDSIDVGVDLIMPRVMYAWPNPATEIHISIPSPGGEIRIYDIMGHLMMTTELMEGVYNPSVSIESLASGSYFLV